MSTPPLTIILAHSGGPDSMYALHWLMERGHQPILAHLNHRIRGTASAADAQFVREQAIAHQLVFHIRQRNVKTWAKQHHQSIETAGRQLRYAFFEELRQQYNADWIMTGHHLDDNLETVLMNRARGCGLRGQIGMTEYDETRHLWRPLLNLGKTEILNWLKAHAIPSCTDATNTDLRYTRNKIRHQVIPQQLEKNPHLYERFRTERNQALKQLQSNRRQAAQWLIQQNIKAITPPFHFPLDAWSQLNQKQKKFLLSHLYENLYGSTQGLKASHINQWEHLLDRGRTGAQRAFGKQYHLELYNEAAYFKDTHLPPELITNTLRLNGEKLRKDQIQQRRWRPGDRFKPSGMIGTKKVQDYFVDKKIPRHLRDHIPITITEKGRIVAVGTRPDDCFKPQGDTTLAIPIKMPQWS